VSWIGHASRYSKKKRSVPGSYEQEIWEGMAINEQVCVSVIGKNIDLIYHKRQYEFFFVLKVVLVGSPIKPLFFRE